MVVIEEHDEQPGVLAQRLAFLVPFRTDPPGRLGRRVGPPGHLDEPERLDGLQRTVLANLKVLRAEVHHRLALPVGHDDIDPNEVDAGAEDRLRRLLLVRGLRPLRFLGLLGFLGVRAEGKTEHHGERKQTRAAKDVHTLVYPARLRHHPHRGTAARRQR